MIPCTNTPNNLLGLARIPPLEGDTISSASCEQSYSLSLKIVESALNHPSLRREHPVTPASTIGVWSTHESAELSPTSLDLLLPCAYVRLGREETDDSGACTWWGAGQGGVGLGT